jgi:hypothetical protein
VKKVWRCEFYIFPVSLPNVSNSNIIYSIIELNLYIISCCVPTVHQLIRSLMMRNKTTPDNVHSENELAVGGGADKRFAKLISLEQVYIPPGTANSVSMQTSVLALSLQPAARNSRI